MEINGWFSVLRSNAFNISLSNTELHTLAIEHKPSRPKPSFGLVKVNKYPEISLNYLKVFDIIVQWVSICLIVFSKMLEQDQTFLIINQEGRSTLTKIKQDPQMLLHHCQWNTQCVWFGVQETKSCLFQRIPDEDLTSEFITCIG